ncbi:hypothetical protein ACOCG7_09675 [Paraburkholderia sp. DD10]|jgi:hypothetical protein|uniref:Lipoprotein-attachment site-containing protein n=1 Tax=Paraburkholderia terricola TaxID=169427 RepID=A0A1M6YHL2_9BURK|nr:MULTISPECIES: hypothetical protein [Paraburkholderia]SDP38630.1 hypothetical protein SAMN05192547_107010 [Paraburkholderia sediminicola]SHL17555.1 hypothetical protein SAMN05192548_107010 [Paraburkholderia terricola]
MIRSVVAVFAIQLVMLINGCSGNPPKPVLPDGLHRVPVNRVAPASLSDGDGHEQ